MVRHDRTQEALDELAVAADDPGSADTGAVLERALRSKSNLVTARALRIIHAGELRGFEEAMADAFARAMKKPLRSDPGCRTKEGVVRALDLLREPADEVYLAGVRHVQAEPIWGGSRDSAATLRGLCGLALVRRRHPEALTELARLLADPEREARRLAADSVAVTGNSHVGVPLLTLRILAGEAEPEVVGECFSALLCLDAPRTLDFVTAYLESRDDLLAEAAALALAQERPAGAFSALRAACDGSVGERFRLLCMALSMLRSEEAWAYLLARIRDDSSFVARNMIEALGMYREQPVLANRIREAVAQRDEDRESLEGLLTEWARA